MKNHKQEAFSLIELAAVVMVIAFLISGISVAYSMIKQASLRSIITEANTFTEAINLFEQKYKSLPGDFPYASVQWGTACDSTPSNCNGDGDGMISYSSSLLKNESMRAWQHLSLAGMISGSYTGIATVAGQTVLELMARLQLILLPVGVYFPLIPTVHLIRKANIYKSGVSIRVGRQIILYYFRPMLML
ncbi:N-methylation domain-containing protein [endosymbiont of Acanthamoeba sp. UWC8]|nr:N-methylation domain-containing protein [endosymbiont of Acanthamoeba sp. UWC8]